MKKRIKQAQKYLEWNKPNQAIAELRSIINSKQLDEQYAWIPNHMMGIALSQKGEHKSSADYLLKAIEKGSDVPETLHMLSVNHLNLGRLKEAEHYGKQALDLNADFLKAWLNLGSIYRAQAQLEKALECYQKANQLDPKNAGVAFRIGEIYRDQGDLNKAMELFDITLKIEENHIRATLEKADLYKKKGNYKKAEEWLGIAKEEHGDRMSIQVARAELYKSQGDYDKAIGLYEKLLEGQPQNVALRVNYALCLQEVSRFDESEKNYRQAIKLAPDRKDAISNYLMGLHYNPENSKEFIFDEHVRLGVNFKADTRHEQAVPADISKDKQLKVGFVSGGFRRHPVGFMIAGSLEQLPGSQFEIYCYTTNNKYDFVTRRIHQNIDVWRSIVGYSTNVIEDLIREDELDILVDLSGHAADNCLDVMARKPAPVVVKWVGGLFNTTGIEAFDYLISDWQESPKGEEEFYTEKLVRLPDDYISFTPPSYTPDVGPLPAEEKRYITFGCFNNPTKVNETVLRRWAEIMREVSKSRLFLKSKQYDTASFRDQIVDIMEAEGISKERIEFQGHTSHDDHLQAYNEVDIALDPWPYSGGLTTCEAIDMGVPVITLPGPTFAGRHSATHLVNAGLEEWVAEDWETYIQKTISLATDWDQLKEWRTKLRSKIRNSAVCDGKRFGAHLAVGFRKMWERRVDGYENNRDDWQEHISVQSLTDQEINDLVCGPNKMMPIKMKNESSQDVDGLETESQETMESNDMLVAEEKEDTDRLALDFGNKNSKNGTNEISQSKPAKDTFYIETKNKVTICTPVDKNLLTPYVLLEQHDWMEPELDFVRQYLQSGMKVVDAGAAFGVYALPMAKLVGEKGKVVAFEPGALARQYLKESKEKNGFRQLQIFDRGLDASQGTASLKEIGTPELNLLTSKEDGDIKVTTLDSWWKGLNGLDVDLLKVDVNGMEPAVLAGALTMLEETAAIILVAISDNAQRLGALREQFDEIGYQLFEYIPGPGLLAEYEQEVGLDSYTKNVVAIPESRIEEFKKSGWTFDEAITFHDPSKHAWEEVLGNMPWAKDKLSEWQKLALSGQHEEYYQTLNMICTAEQMDATEGSADARSRKGALMLAAAQQLITLFNNGQAGVAAAMTYTRVMRQLGKNEQALEMMKQLMDTANSGEDIIVQLPFLPPLQEQDATQVNTDFAKWFTVRVVEAWIMIKDVSTFFSGEQEKQMLEALKGNPEALDRFNDFLKYKAPSTQTKISPQPKAGVEAARHWKSTLFNFLMNSRPLEVKNHDLPSELIVSVTSYPARFDTLHLTLACLLNQTVRADRTILWIAHEDKPKLPQKVLALQNYGMEINYCEDLKSYKKVIPTLEQSPDSFVVTADDDAYYWQTWLEELVKGWHRNKECVIAHRVHRVQKDQNEDLLPYDQWDLRYTEKLKPSGLNFPTGLGGVLYPPGVFHEDVMDEEKFMELCPHGDDIWLYWMYRMNGVEVKPTGNNSSFTNWPESQNEALWTENLGQNRNDKQIQNMVDAYGFPDQQ